MPANILTQPQALAIYKSMLLLNGVGALIRVDMNDGDLSVQQHHKSGVVTVTSLANLPCGRDFESYPGQASFAAAYGLIEHRQDCSAVAAPDYWSPSHFFCGQRVKYGEHDAVIESHYHEGMWNVRLPGGPACVSGASLTSA